MNEKPKNKTQLIKWLKSNIGTELSFIREVRFYDRTGAIVASQNTMVSPLSRIVNKTQTNAVNFTGTDEEGKPLERPTWLYFDIPHTEYFFADDRFEIIRNTDDYQNVNVSGEEVEVRKALVLNYSYK